MRGSTPLDVAAASCIDNNELALALQEQDLEMVRPNGTHLGGNNKNLKIVVQTCHPKIFPGGEISGWVWTSELSHAAVQRLPGHWLESLRWREIPGLSPICCLRQRLDVFIC